MKMKRVLSVGLVGAMALSTLALTGCGSNSGDGGSTDFSWWIYSTDGNGVYYDSYEDNPSVQWLNQQYWDTENGGLGTEEDGTPVRFSFQVPDNILYPTVSEMPPRSHIYYASDSPLSFLRKEKLCFRRAFLTFSFSCFHNLSRMR